MSTSTKPTSITRTELHSLVWREPRSKLASVWGISDVAIGKLCVRECIPAPRPGYWAKKAAGGRTLISPLTMRLPGQRELVELRALNRYERFNEPGDLASPIALPSYTETVEEVVQSAFARLGPFRAKRDLSDPHPGLSRVLRSEEKRAEKSRVESWSYYKPLFLESRFQRQLRVFSSIFYILDAINARCEVAENDTWIQGVGHLHHLTASICIGACSVQLQFLEPENPKGSKDLPRSNTTALRVGSADSFTDFVDDPSSKIERRLDDIVKAILVNSESVMRAADFSNYEWKTERRRKALEELAERERKEEESRLAAIKAKREAIRKEIANAAGNLRSAQDIRSLVAAMAEHPDWVGDGRSNFLRWSELALAEANALDPMLQPVNQSFKVWDASGN
jgi:hypothetical protein